MVGGDRLAARPQHPRERDDRRLDHPGAVELGRLEDRLDDRADPAPRPDVEPLERRRRLLGGVARDEVAPQLADEERRVQRVADHQAAGRLPAVVARLAEDGLGLVVPACGLPAEVVVAELAAPVAAPAAERTGQLAHVALGVGAAVGTEAEELHHLAGVVLVDRATPVRGAVEEDQHRRVAGDVEQQLLEAPERVAAEEVRLLEHQPLGADAVEARGEPVVQDERHALRELVARADHPVEPGEVVVAPRARRVERLGDAAGDVGRLGARERRRAGRAQQRRHRAVEPEGGEPGAVARARAEAGAPQEALGLAGAERAGVDRSVVALGAGDRQRRQALRLRGRGRRRGRLRGRRRRLRSGLRRRRGPGGRGVHAPAAAGQRLGGRLGRRGTGLRLGRLAGHLGLGGGSGLAGLELRLALGGRAGGGLLLLAPAAGLAGEERDGHLLCGRQEAPATSTRRWAGRTVNGSW